MDFEYIHQAYLSDGQLLELYRKARAEKLLGKVFMSDAFGTEASWVEYVRARCWLVLMTTGDNLEPFAVFWLDSFCGKVALFHYWCYRRAWGVLTDEVIAGVFEYLKGALDGQVRHLIGYTPKSNRLAVRILRKAGFEEKFELFGAQGDEDMIVSHKEI